MARLKSIGIILICALSPNAAWAICIGQTCISDPSYYQKVYWDYQAHGVINISNYKGKYVTDQGFFNPSFLGGTGGTSIYPVGKWPTQSPFLSATASSNPNFSKGETGASAVWAEAKMSYTLEVVPQNGIKPANSIPLTLHARVIENAFFDGNSNAYADVSPTIWVVNSNNGGWTNAEGFNHFQAGQNAKPTQPYTIEQQISFIPNKLYTVTYDLSVDTWSSYYYTKISANIDPFFTIDPIFANQYDIVVSQGVGNSPPAPGPTPGAGLAALALAGLYASARRG